MCICLSTGAIRLAFRPGDQRVECWAQRLAPIGEGVLHLGRHLMIDNAADDAVFRERQNFGGSGKLLVGRASDSLLGTYMLLLRSGSYFRACAFVCGLQCTFSVTKVSVFYE